MTLLGRTVLVLGLLFGLFFAVAMAALAYLGLSFYWGIAFAASMIVLQYLIAPTVIQWIYKIRWVEMTELSPAVREYLHSICRQLRIPVPRLGIIEDGNPNAFTFGHYPGDARLVVTRGLLNLLDENEHKAVVGHEVGHIVHWDFVVMTIAVMIPLILYTIYRLTIGLPGRGSRGSGGRGYTALVGIIAFIAYVISQFIVLLLSRVREYYADEFSARSNHNPNSLATALVKVAYGLARAPQQEEKKADLVTAQAGKALGIFDHKVAGNLALSAAGMTPGTTITSDAIVDAMKWDLWNPWANWYELNSTHPLPARRIRALEKICNQMRQPPVFDFPEKQPESYWDEFAVDFLTNILPALGLVMGLAIGGIMVLNGGNPLLMGGACLLGLGLGSLIKVLRSHAASAFPARTVESLVAEVKVSGVRAIPCTVEGRIIGRGIPGLFVSEDLVLQDSTGYMVLDYRQPIRLLDWLFGIFQAEQFIGQNARAVGWFRRSPMPYLELLRIEFDGLPGGRCYAYTAQLILSIVGLSAGLVLLLVAMAMR